MQRQQYKQVRVELVRVEHVDVLRVLQESPGARIGVQISGMIDGAKSSEAAPTVRVRKGHSRRNLAPHDGSRTGLVNESAHAARTVVSPGRTISLALIERSMWSPPRTTRTLPAECSARCFSLEATCC